MKITRLKKSLSLFLCIVLIAATALTTIGCNDSNSSTVSPQESTVATAETVQVLGEGETEFMFTVTDVDGKETSFEIHTDKATVGDALMQLELIDGEDSEYGLYVKTVNGITLDYDTDGKYWAFYVNGEYASSGVDTTDISYGETYSFKAE